MSLRRPTDLDTLRNANGDVAFATAFGTLIGGAFLVGFIQSLGGSVFWINFVSAIPSLFGVLQIPGAIWGRSFTSYKKFVLPFGASWRLLHLPLVALPILALSHQWKLGVLVACVGLAWALIPIGTPIYNDWMAELVPANSRGYFFGRRHAISTMVAAVVGIIGALFLDGFRASNQQDLGFCVIFGLGVTCAALSMFFFCRMKDLVREHPIKQNVVEGLKAIGTPFRDREFRKVLIFLGVAGIGQTLSGNLFPAFGLATLHLSYRVIQGAVLMQAVGTIVGARLWGYVSDKYGNKPVLAMSGLALALNPIPWMLCVPGKDMYNTILLLSTHIVMGFSWSGIALCQFNLILATARAEDRANYLGAGMTVSALIGGVSPLLGAALFTQMGSFSSEVMAYKFVFGIVVLLRVLAVFFLVPVKERGSVSLATTLRDLRTVTPRGFRAIRTLNRGADIATRETAIRSVATDRVHMAADEVIKALHDPLPRVRRQAAAALARLDDPRAVEELIHQLDEHPALVEEETIEALGAIGDSRAFPLLVKYLSSPSSILRRAAARGLGRVGRRDPDSPATANAASALIRSVRDDSDPDLRRAALQALRSIGSGEAMGGMVAAPVIAQALLDPQPSVRVAAAEAVSELGLKQAAPLLRQSLLEFRDEAASEVAYALGASGGIEDLALILEEARQSVSIITRRRCLLGVARLLGVEAEAYRLLLMEGVARDGAFAELRKRYRRRPEVVRALNLFVAGEEALALNELSDLSPLLAKLAAHPSSELFLIAVLIL